MPTKGKFTHLKHAITGNKVCNDLPCNPKMLTTDKSKLTCEKCKRIAERMRAA